MKDYLKDELAFLRGISWHILLLCLACVLVRSAGEHKDPSSIGGIPLQINNVLFVVAAPLYALMVQFIAFVEANSLSVVRRTMIDEMRELWPTFRLQIWGATALLMLPTLISFFLISQFFVMVAPATLVDAAHECQQIARSSHFMTYYAGPSIYCMRNIVEGNPWIYLPFYDVALVLVGAATALLCAMSISRWFSDRM